MLGFSSTKTETREFVQGPAQLSTPLYSQLTLRIYAATKEMGGNAQIDFVPGRRKTLGTPP